MRNKKTEKFYVFDLRCHGPRRQGPRVLEPPCWPQDNPLLVRCWGEEIRRRERERERENESVGGVDAKRARAQQTRSSCPFSTPTSSSSFFLLTPPLNSPPPASQLTSSPQGPDLQVGHHLRQHRRLLPPRRVHLDAAAVRRDGHGRHLVALRDADRAGELQPAHRQRVHGDDGDVPTVEEVRAR